MPDENDKQPPWVVRDVPEETRKKVKAYAALYGLTMAQAVTKLIDMGLVAARESGGLPVPFIISDDSLPLDSQIYRLFGKMGLGPLGRQIEDKDQEAHKEEKGETNASEETPNGE